MQPYIQTHPDSAQLDALITKLRAGEKDSLVVEHLETAHAYLQGAMPEECAHNLELARQQADRLSDKALANDVKVTVDGLLHELHPAQPPHRANNPKSNGTHTTATPSATAKGLDEFFQGDDQSLGIFYPKKHVVAVFTSFEQACAARDTLSATGFRIWEVIAVPGDEIVRFLEELKEHHALWSSLMTEFSRVLDTEATLADDYEVWARKGAGFLVAYSSSQPDAERVFELIEPLDPFAAHWFMAGSIRHLM